MNAPGTEPRPWSMGRWVLLIALVFVGQIGLIFAVSDHKPMEPRRVALAPELRVPFVTNDLLALTDPTLFALPSAHGFSAGAWRGTNGFSADAWVDPPRDTPHAFEWSETNQWNQTNQWLPLPVGQLGGVLAAFMQTNRMHISYEITRPPEAVIVLPPPKPTPAAQTTLRVDGDLTERQLVNAPLLPPMPFSDVLLPSAVQVFVDDAGNVVTTALIPPGSGSDNADQQALRLARAVRFAPLSHAGDDQMHWTRGSLIFQWGTVPINTNAPPAAP